MTLKELGVGQTGVITAVGGEGALRQHFLDMGVLPGTEVTVEKLAPMGDPMELRLHGYMLTLRLADAHGGELLHRDLRAGEDAHIQKMLAQRTFTADGGDDAGLADAKLL